MTPRTRDFGIDEETLDSFLDSMRGTRFSDITEFGRAVHAEMDAITTAARLGTSVRGGTVVCTTFPCHGCTRHIVASGIRRVVFIHPYIKSLARDLHEDAIVFEPEERGPIKGKVVFEQYTGVAPRCYPQYFYFGPASRRDPAGRAMRAGDPIRATPRVLERGGLFAFGGPIVPIRATAAQEQGAANRFEELAEDKGLTVPKPTNDKEQE